MPLLIVTAVTAKDIDLAVKMYQWIGTLGGIHNNDVLIVADQHDNIFSVNRVILMARKVARNVQRIGCQPHKPGWPQGPNAAFKSACDYARVARQPFLWLEPDCVPIGKGWLEAIEKEYAGCGKPYMGEIVAITNPKTGITPGLLGVAVYPANVEHLDSIPEHVPFDLHVGVRVAKQAHKSALFQWFGGPGDKREPPKSLSNIRPGTMLFHADKSGFLIGALKDNKPQVPKQELPPKTMLKRGTKTEMEIPCFVQLGRIGDILNILPIVRLWSSIRYNSRIPFLVHSDYRHVLKRIGYAFPIEWKDSLQDLPEAAAFAKKSYDKVFVCQLFGKQGVTKGKQPNYNLDQWDNCGQTKAFSLYPLEIDDRDFATEDKWFAANRKTDKPLICYNLKGNSSPFNHSEKVEGMLKKKFSDCELWNLDALRTEFYTDQLVALDRCAALLTVDTSTLHLAQASHCKYIALLSDVRDDGWTATKTRRSPALELRYPDVNTPRKMKEIERVLRSCVDAVQWKPGKIWHVVQRRQIKDQRIQDAEHEWNGMYASGALNPIHVWRTDRDSNSVVGDKRGLPFLRDVLQVALQTAAPNDVVIFTNDDVTFNARCVEEIIAKLRYVPIVTASRCDTAQGQIKNRTRHLGRDLVAFTGKSLKENIDAIPDFILGASEWDIVLAAMARNKCGLTTVGNNIGMMHADCETSVGTLLHASHESVWSKPENVSTLPSQVHNRTLAEEWLRQNAADFILPWFNRL